MSTGLRTLSTDAASELDVLGHDGDTLGVDGAEVGVGQEGDHVGLGGLLDGEDGAGRLVDAHVGEAFGRDGGAEIAEYGRRLAVRVGVRVVPVTVRLLVRSSRGLHKLGPSRARSRQPLGSLQPAR